MGNRVRTVVSRILVTRMLVIANREIVRIAFTVLPSFHAISGPGYSKPLLSGINPFPTQIMSKALGIYARRSLFYLPWK